MLRRMWNNWNSHIQLKQEAPEPNPQASAKPEWRLWGKEGHVPTAHGLEHSDPKTKIPELAPPRLSQQQKQLLSGLGTMAIFLPQPIFFFDWLQYTINCISQGETVP